MGWLEAALMGWLAHRFLNCAGHGPAPDALEPVLGQLLEQARAGAGWSFDSLAFVSQLAACRLSPGAELADLAARKAFDVGRAVACLAGDAAAVATVGRDLDEAAAFACQRVVRTVDPDDLRQILALKVLLDRPDRPADLRRYGGRGALAAWARAVAGATALNLARQRAPLAEGGEAPPERLADPELEFIQAQHRELFAAAFHEALGGLTPRSRTVLRLYLGDGLNIDAIGRSFGVHRATVARWISAAREQLLDQTYRNLRARLDGAAVESLMRSLPSRLDVSILRYVR